MLFLFQTQEHIEHVLAWLNEEINVADLPQMLEDADPEVKQSNQMKCHKYRTQCNCKTLATGQGRSNGRDQGCCLRPLRARCMDGRLLCSMKQHMISCYILTIFLVQLNKFGALKVFVSAF